MTIVGADNSAKQAAAELQWPARCRARARPRARGSLAGARKQCDVRVRIAGTGAIDSLNVSVAAGVLIASYLVAERRRNGDRDRRIESDSDSSRSRVGEDSESESESETDSDYY